MQSNSQTEKELGERERGVQREREREKLLQQIFSQVETGDEDATALAAREIVA